MLLHINEIQCVSDFHKLIETNSDSCQLGGKRWDVEDLNSRLWTCWVGVSWNVENWSQWSPLCAHTDCSDQLTIQQFFIWEPFSEILFVVVWQSLRSGFLMFLQRSHGLGEWLVLRQLRQFFPPLFPSISSRGARKSFFLVQENIFLVQDNTFSGARVLLSGARQSFWR